METINSLQKAAFEIAKNNGFHEQPNPIPEVLMKMVCELSEGMEEYRNNKPTVYVNDNGVREITDLKESSFLSADGETTTLLKPEGILSELADTVIRILDTCESNGWDLASMIRIKMKYNRTRSWKHGGKVC